MPQPDAYHEAVKRALIKDGWAVTHDPLVIKYKGLRLFVDLAAEKPTDDRTLDLSPIGAAGTPVKERIAVEIKVFGRASFLNEFEKAVGQFLLYRDMMERTQVRRELFLAVAQPIYEASFTKPASLSRNMKSTCWSSPLKRRNLFDG